jgi:hypothetical protein
VVVEDKLINLSAIFRSEMQPRAAPVFRSVSVVGLLRDNNSILVEFPPDAALNVHKTVVMPLVGSEYLGARCRALKTPAEE